MHRGVWNGEQEAEKAEKGQKDSKILAQFKSPSCQSFRVFYDNQYMICAYF